MSLTGSSPFKQCSALGGEEAAVRNTSVTLVSGTLGIFAPRFSTWLES